MAAPFFNTRNRMIIEGDKIGKGKIFARDPSFLVNIKQVLENEFNNIVCSEPLRSLEGDWHIMINIYKKE